MRLAIGTFCVCFIIISGLTYYLCSTVIAGALNTREFFTEQVEAEFNDKSLCLIRNRICQDDNSLNDEFQTFMKKYGVVMVARLPNENSVDWQICVRGRMVVHYICKLSEQARLSWDFRVGSIDGSTCNEVLSGLIVRNNIYRRGFLISICAFILTCFLKAPHRILFFQCAISKKFRSIIIIILWLINTIGVFIAFEYVGIAILEWVSCRNRGLGTICEIERHCIRNLQIEEQSNTIAKHVYNIAYPSLNIIGERCFRQQGIAISNSVSPVLRQINEESRSFINDNISFKDANESAEHVSMKNQMMDELLNLPQIPSDYGVTMIGLFRDRSQDVLTRDFAVQHIGLYAQALSRQGTYDSGSKDAAACRAALFDAAKETKTIVAAAAFRALADMAEFDSNVDARRLDVALASCICDTSVALAVRVMAAQLCGERGVGSACSALKMVSANPDTPEALRRAAEWALASLDTKNPPR